MDCLVSATRGSDLRFLEFVDVGGNVHGLVHLVDISLSDLNSGMMRSERGTANRSLGIGFLEHELEL